ncbi:MAG: molybdate transport system substrate-binding protein [Flavobacteriales bacterium]|jgi:molybdate transport system substrate-binding protein
MLSLTFCVAGCYAFAVSANNGTLTIAVASNFRSTMQDLQFEFKTNNSIPLRITYGSSGKLATQIRYGAPFDVFLSADQHRIQQLDSLGLILDSSQHSYALGRLALWSPQIKNLENGHILTNTNRKRLAIANAKLAPYGQAAHDVLETLGIKGRSETLKIIEGENIAQTFQFAVTGNCDFAFIAYSQWLTLDRQRKANSSYWLVPESKHTAIIQEAAIINHSKHKDSAKIFMQFLRSPSAQNIITAHGYSKTNAKPKSSTKPRTSPKIKANN